MSGSGGPGALPPRATAREPILDTYKHRARDLEPEPDPPDFADLAPQKTPALPLPGAQLGFDGESYLPEPDPSGQALPDVPNRLTRDQIRFEFATEGVQLSFEEWRTGFAAALRWFEGPDSTRAERADRCGSLWMIRKCKCCGAHNTEDVSRSANCESRTCPSCARKASAEKRVQLNEMFRRLPMRPRGVTWWFHTLTLQRPVHTSVARLEQDYDLAWTAWKKCWKYLQSVGAKGAVAKLEVGRGGMVHIHATVRGMRLKRHQLETLLAVYRQATGSRWYNVRQAYSHSGTSAELAKYLTKGVASARKQNQTHPLLAAMVDTAFRSRRVWREYGELPLDEPPPKDPGPCPACDQSEGWYQIYVTQEQLNQIVRYESRGPP